MSSVKRPVPLIRQRVRFSSFLNYVPGVLSRVATGGQAVLSLIYGSAYPLVLIVPVRDISRHASGIPPHRR